MLSCAVTNVGAEGPDGGDLGDRRMTAGKEAAREGLDLGGHRPLLSPSLSSSPPSSCVPLRPCQRGGGGGAAALGFVNAVAVLSTVTPATKTMVTFVHRDGTWPRSGRRSRLNGGGDVRSGATPASRGPSARTAGAVRGGCNDASRRLGCLIKTFPESSVVFLEAGHLASQLVWLQTPAIGPLSWGRGLSRCLVGKTTEGATIHGADPVRRPVSSSSHDGRNRLFSGLGQKEKIPVAC